MEKQMFKAIRHAIMHAHTYATTVDMVTRSHVTELTRFHPFPITGIILVILVVVIVIHDGGRHGAAPIRG